ncbi:hypothetical protein HN873_030004 [Arachis hypogaea]
MNSGKTVFLYPWAIGFDILGISVFIEALIFVLILIVGSVYAWRKGATQYSGDPFPEPIRVLVGLTVTDLSGNIRTHICPPRRTFRDIARRPAS